MDENKEITGTGGPLDDLGRFPTSSGVYLMKDGEETILYVCATTREAETAVPRSVSFWRRYGASTPLSRIPKRRPCSSKIH